MSDVRLICNSSSFCSDKRVGVLGFQEDRWGPEEQEKTGNKAAFLETVYAAHKMIADMMRGKFLRKCLVGSYMFK